MMSMVEKLRIEAGFSKTITQNLVRENGPITEINYSATEDQLHKFVDLIVEECLNITNFVIDVHDSFDDVRLDVKRTFR